MSAGRGPRGRRPSAPAPRIFTRDDVLASFAAHERQWLADRAATLIPKRHGGFLVRFPRPREEWDQGW